jgi:hypothetical protein
LGGVTAHLLATAENFSFAHLQRIIDVRRALLMFARNPNAWQTACFKHLLSTQVGTTIGPFSVGMEKSSVPSIITVGYAAVECHGQLLHMYSSQDDNDCQPHLQAFDLS